MKIDLVYSDEIMRTGVHRYAQTLADFVQQETDDEVELVPFERREWSFMGKSVGGYLSLWGKKIKERFDGDVVHALDPVVGTIGTDVTTVHDLIPYKYPEIYKNTIGDKLSHYINNWFTRKSEYYLVQTEHVKSDLMKYWDVDESRILKTGFGVCHDLFYPSDEVPECMQTEKDVLLFVSDNNPRKNLRLILKSMKHIDRDIRLVKVGSNKWGEVHKECKEIIENNSLDVVFTGYVDDEKLRDYYTHADLYVYPSLDEGVGYTPLEAMRCGTTTLVSDIPVFHETMGDMTHYSAITTGGSEAYKLARNIKYSLQNLIEPSQLINYVKQFKWEDVARETTEYYRMIKNEY